MILDLDEPSYSLGDETILGFRQDNSSWEKFEKEDIKRILR